MRDLLDRTAVSAAGHDLTVADLVLAGVRSGRWQAFEARVAAGLERDAADVDTAALKPAVIAWRRERGLIAGDELAAWLAEREVSKDDWQGCLRRAHLRGAGAPASREPEPGEITAVLRVEAICDGVFLEIAREMILAAGAARALEEAGAEADPPPGEAEGLAEAARLVVAPLRDLDDLEERAARVVALETARERFIAERVRDAEVERLMEDRRLDWATIAWEEAAFATEDAAREAAMLVREDGLSLEEAAAVASAPMTRTSMRLAEVGGELGPLLVAAHPGDVIGPRTGEGVSRLVSVIERRLPSTEDPQLVDRARDELLTEGLTRHLAGMVVWHGAV